MGAPVSLTPVEIAVDRLIARGMIPENHRSVFVQELDAALKEAGQAMMRRLGQAAVSGVVSDKVAGSN